MAFNEEDETSLDSPQLFAAGVAVMVLALLFIFFFQKEPLPEPSNSAAYGCYGSANAPPILLNENGFQALDAEMAPIGFTLRRGKTGILLVLDSTVEANRAGARYRIETTNDFGVFIPFYRVANGTVWGVLDETELNSFRFLMRDGRYLPYERTRMQACQPEGTSVN